MDKSYFYRNAPALIEEIEQLTERFLQGETKEPGQIVNLAIQCERAIDFYHEQEKTEAVAKLKECKLKLANLWADYTKSLFSKHIAKCH